MRRFFLFSMSILLVLLFAINVKATEMPDSIYGPYQNFEQLYSAYMDAVESEDYTLQEELLEIGRTSLQIEIAIAEQYSTQPTADAIEQYWREQFPTYFSYGYWGTNYFGDTLSLGNKLSIWSVDDKANGWQATYMMFRNHRKWDNTDIMKEQFYCHARLGYAAFEEEWNLEPGRTTMNPITCNEW